MTSIRYLTAVAMATNMNLSSNMCFKTLRVGFFYFYGTGSLFGKK